MPTSLYYSSGIFPKEDFVQFSNTLLLFVGMLNACARSGRIRRRHSCPTINITIVLCCLPIVIYLPAASLSSFSRFSTCLRERQGGGNIFHKVVSTHHHPQQNNSHHCLSYQSHILVSTVNSALCK